VNSQNYNNKIKEGVSMREDVIDFFCCLDGFYEEAKKGGGKMVGNSRQIRRKACLHLS
jgi:hypothetical protein